MPNVRKSGETDQRSLRSAQFWKKNFGNRPSTAVTDAYPKSIKVERVIEYGPNEGTVALGKNQIFSYYDWVTAVAAMIAGLFPAIFKSLDLDVSLKNIADNAGRFKILQDRFRQASRISADRGPEELEEEFQALMTRMDDARLSCPAIPERHFRKAQKKIKQGDYSFDNTPED